MRSTKPASASPLTARPALPLAPLLLSGLLGLGFGPALAPGGLAAQETEAARASRQAAPELGEISFPVSADGEAEARFHRGVLYLHSFEYGDALREFRAAREADPEFAMAYWGEAMAHNHPVWFEQDSEAGREALRRLAPTLEGRLAGAPTERERDWLRAVDVLYFGPGTKEERDDAYAREMERLAGEHPDDDELQTFYALSLLGTAHEGRDIPTYMRAAAVADRVFDENPRHPGAAHYLIHAFDDPAHAPLGLPAARAYSKIAPAASHAQHMTSHIFVALGLWDDAVRANRTAYEVSGGENFHAYYWLGYALLQQDRLEGTREVFREMYRRQTGHEPTESAGDEVRGSLHYPAVMRAQLLVHTEDWSGVAARTAVDPGRLGAEAAAATRFVDGWGALARGEAAAVREELAGLEDLAASLEQEGGHPVDRGIAAVTRDELAALLALEEGRTEVAVSLLRTAVEREDALPASYGPPRIVKPSAELLGETLLALERPAEAVEAFRTALRWAPRRARSLEGLAEAAGRSGDARAAEAAGAELREIRGAPAGAREGGGTREGG